jgi:hypothetical protein
MKRSWLEPLAIMLVVLAALLACKVGKHASGDDEDDSPKSSSAKATKVDAADLIRAYKDNEVSADDKYKGKWVKVSGIVGEIKKDITDSIYVTIGTGKQFEFPIVQCFAAKGQAKKAGKLKRGDRITAKGRVDGMLMNVLVKECTF